jgi:hypothetical protein
MSPTRSQHAQLLEAVGEAEDSAVRQSVSLAPTNRRADALADDARLEAITAGRLEGTDDAGARTLGGRRGGVL